MSEININFVLHEEDIPAGTITPLVEMEAKMKLFLAAYLQYGTISKGCEVAGLHRKTFEQWRENIDKFNDVFREIEETFTDRLEEEANRRALEKSDSLLQFLLKARRPDKFNPTQNLHATFDGESGIKLIFSEAELSPEERRILEGGAENE